MRSSKQLKIRMSLHFLYACFILLLSVNCFSQVERADIIEKKIRSVKKTIYQDNDTSTKEVIQNYYSKAGDDSLEFYNGELSFSFIATYNENGKVSKLARIDSKSREDELHRYTYNKNGSYAIEIIAQGAGTVSLTKYDKKNFCTEEEIEGSYTLVYVRNANGKTQKILSKQKDNKTETIAVFYFDKNGLATKGEGTTEGGKTVYFKYNENNLVSEIRTIGRNEEGKEETEIILLEYKFYD